MSILNKLSMGTSLLKAKITGDSFPFMVNWAITGRCNLRCSHCYGDYGQTQSRELPLEVMKDTIVELKKMGTKRFTIEGGEPLFRKDIDEILACVHENGMEQSICTNGIFLDKHIEAVKKYVDLVVFSLDGKESFHDNLRGKNTYQKTIEAMELTRKNNVRTLLFCCLIDENIEDIDYVVDLAREYNTHITFNIAVAKINEEGEGDRKSLNKVNDEKYKKAIQKILDLKKKGAPIFYSDKNYKQALKWPNFQKEKYTNNELAELEAHQKKTMIPCYAGKRFCYIECDGNVYPCYQLVGTMKVKNIVDHGIREAFDHLVNSNYCTRCYNLTLSELNLQSNLDPGSVVKVLKNYLS